MKLNEAHERIRVLYQETRKLIYDDLPDLPPEEAGLVYKHEDGPMREELWENAHFALNGLCNLGLSVEKLAEQMGYEGLKSMLAKDKNSK